MVCLVIYSLRIFVCFSERNFTVVDDSQMTLLDARTLHCSRFLSQPNRSSTAHSLSVWPRDTKRASQRIRVKSCHTQVSTRGVTDSPYRSVCYLQFYTRELLQYSYIRKLYRTLYKEALDCSMRGTDANTMIV